MLDAIIEYARLNKVPIIRPQSGKLLQAECQKVAPKTILEIGTAIGYSGILMLMACSATLVTIEKNENMFSIAKENFAKFGFSTRVKQILADAADVLKDLDEKFDFIFLDGPKGQYIKYLPYLEKLLNYGGVLFADDIYFHGLVKADQPISHRSRSMVNNLRLFISALENSNTLESSFLDIEDGISISKKKKE